jgi:hypothetical protein
MPGSDVAWRAGQAVTWRGAQVRDDADSRVIQFEAAARPAGDAGGVLQALLVLPKRQAAGGGAQPLVEIRKAGGPLTDADLAVIAAAMRSANSLTDQARGHCTWLSSGDGTSPSGLFVLPTQGGEHRAAWCAPYSGSSVRVPPRHC